jgi:hypothetical protein
METATPLDQPKRNSTFTMYLAEAGNIGNGQQQTTAHLKNHRTSHDVQNGTEWQWVCLKTTYTLVYGGSKKGEDER